MIAAVWLAGSIGAYLYSQQQHIPAAIAVPVALAFLVEVSLYVTMVRAAGWPTWLLAATPLVPYLLFSVPTGTFRLSAFVLLGALVAVAAWWFPVLPRRQAIDLLFLLLMASIYLARPFPSIYSVPFPELRVDALGQLMWFRIGIVSVLRHRPDEDIGFGFLPARAEWTVGLRHFLLFLPVGAALAVLLHFAAFRLMPGFWWKAPLTFFGILWVVALAEEFFFRGLLQPKLSAWLGNWGGLLLASAAFGLVHLPFREFPNWKFALLAAVAGVFYGRAYIEARAVRASMVTHACVVTTWRMLFA